MKRGMKTFDPSAVQLKLGDFLLPSKLPKVPPEYGHVGRNDVPWGMLGNDKANDCVPAGYAHEQMVWAMATGRPMPRFDDTVSLRNYSEMLIAQGERPYVPGDAATDVGLDPIGAAKYRQRSGLLDADGALHKVDAFVSVGSLDHIDLAAYWFGVVGVGFDLPSTAESQFGHGVPWSDVVGKGVGGHYAPLVGRNSRGMRFFVTWKRLQAATEEYILKHMIGAFAYLSRDYLLATGKSPEGIDWDALNARLREVA